MNTALRFPSPGQRLTADFGRQLARNINSLRITGGPGVRVTQGPNGVTISAASQGGVGSSSASGDYFPFRLSAYMDADSGKHYAVVMTNDGSVQLLPSGTGHRFATAENAEATMAVENGWRLVAGAFSCAKDAKTEAVTTTVTSLATLEDYAWDKDDPRFDVYAVIYRTADETYSFVVTDTLEQPGAVDPLGEDAFVACVYVGTFQRTYDEDTEQYSYGVSNQVLRSALVLREEADADALRPFKMKVWKAGDGAEWPVVYCPAKSVQIDRTAEGEGVADATALNSAASGAGTDWLYVGGAFGTDGSTTDSKVDALSFGADGTAGIWLFVSKDATTSAYRYAVAAVENWPTAVDESSRVAKVYLGSFAKTEAEDADGNSTTVYSVASQVVNDAQIVRTGGEEELYPFKLKRINEGTEDAPSWKTVVYLPADAVQLSDAIETKNLCDAATDVGDGWYYVGDSDKTSATVYLSILYWSPYTMVVSGQSWKEHLYFLVTTSKGCYIERPASAFDDVTPDADGIKRITLNRQFGIVVGSFDKTQNTATNVLRSAYVIEWTRKSSASSSSSGSSSESGGGGDDVGTYVSVTEAYDGAAATALVVADKTSSAPKSVTFTKYSFLESTAVKVDESDLNAVTLGDYIASKDVEAKYGSVDATKSGSDGVRAPFKEYEGEPSPTYGANINTKNFETLCLQSNPTSDVVVGSEKVAARADHKHYAEDIYYEDENDKDQGMFSNIDAFLEYIESLKKASGDGSGEGGETAEDVAPKDTRLVTYGDLLKENTATQGADGIGTDKAETPLQDDSSKTAGVNENVLAEATLKELAIDQQSWDRATDETSKGFTYSVCCGVKYIPSKYGVYLVFRDVSVDKYGMVCKVSAAKFALYYPVVV